MWLQIVQIIVALLLVISILLQSQGAGLSTAFGGGGEMYRSKQGMEKFLVIATVLLAIILATLSLILLKLQS